MIKLGSLVTLREDFPTTYLPDSDKGFLTSVSLTRSPKPKVPVKTLRHLNSVGFVSIDNSPMEISLNYLIDPTEGLSLFQSVLEKAQTLTDRLYKGTLISFSESTFVPLFISSVALTFQANTAPTYTIGFQYFNADVDYLETDPFTDNLLTTILQDFEIDIRDTENEDPIQGKSFNLAAQIQILKTLDGYYGLRFSPFTLSESVTYFDDSFAPTFSFASFYDEATTTTNFSSSMQPNETEIFTLTKQGIILAANETILEAENL